MATFEVQVEGITSLAIDGSSSPTQDELTQFLRDGVIDVTSRWLAVNPQDRENFQRESSAIENNGDFDLKGAQIISVIREAEADGSSDGSSAWRNCRKIPASMQSRVVDTDSLSFASKYNPVYTIIDFNEVHVYPTPDGTNDSFKVFYVNHIPKDLTNSADLAYTHSDIKYFPANKVYLVVIYASMQALMARMTSLNSALPSDITLPALPATPTMNTTTVSIPSFTAPDAFVQPVVPAGANIDFSSVPTAPTYVPAAAPALTATTISETSITEPSFTPPTMNPPDFGDTNTWISTEEDSEMLSSRVQEIQAKIGEYSARMGESQAKFNEENAIFQKDVQIAMQNAQLEAAEDGTKLQKFSSEVQNEVSRVSHDMQIFKQEIDKATQKYQAETGYDLSKYNAELQAATAKFSNDLQKNNAAFQGDLSKFNTDLQETQQENQQKLAIYNADVQKYGADLNGKMQEFTTSLQKDQADYQWVTGQYTALKAQYEKALPVAGAPVPQQK